MAFNLLSNPENTNLNSQQGLEQSHQLDKTKHEQECGTLGNLYTTGQV